jgi:cytochrome c553
MISTRHVLYLLAAPALGLALSGTALANGDPAAGKEKAASCAACHGADGNAQAPTFPKLAGQHADYLVHALKGYQSGARKNAIMQGLAAPLSEQDIADLAAWFASQSGLHTLKGQR